VKQTLLPFGTNLGCQVVAANLPFVVAKDQQVVLNWLFSAFRYAVVSTKHPGFHEELQWRVIHSPAFEPSTRLIHAVESIRGVPQSVYKIPLHDIPQEGCMEWKFLTCWIE
jgi:hypothetical protein